MKKIYEHPKSGQNTVDAECATHTFYRGQNNDKLFKLEHCWEILRNCAKYNEAHGTARSSATAPILLDPAEFQCDRLLINAVNEDSLTPTIGKRPPGRKASKEKAATKRQKSQDGESSIGDRIAKSIDEINAASAAEIAKVHALNVEEQQMGMRLKTIQMNNARINSIKAVVLERELMAFDALLYSQQPSLIGSLSDAKKRMAEGHTRIEHLTAQAQAFLSYNVEEPPTTQTTRNLNLSFDDEANNPK
ncbi:hypothetical protein Droror1_Dr00027343 [Drosera rotundifolia]